MCGLKGVSRWGECLSSTEVEACRGSNNDSGNNHKVPDRGQRSMPGSAQHWEAAKSIELVKSEDGLVLDAEKKKAHPVVGM